MKSRLKFTLTCVSLLLMPLAHAGSTSYVAHIGTTRWEVQGSVFECSLAQDIPQFGRALFYHQAGEPVVFSLQAHDSGMRAGKALLTSTPPAWRQGLYERDMGYVDVARSRTPVSLDATNTRLVLAELYKGMMPTVTRQAWYSDDDSIRVAVSPVNFKNAYDEYQDCVADLLPVNFGQIERSTVFWQVGQTELDARNKELLDNIVTYVKADPRVYSFEINGFTDTAGTSRENLEMSRRRAFLVHTYLVSKGVDEAMLETRYFGESEDFLIVRNERTPQDRDRNRRVTLLLHRR